MARPNSGLLPAIQQTAHRGPSSLSTSAFSHSRNNPHETRTGPLSTSTQSRSIIASPGSAAAPIWLSTWSITFARRASNQPGDQPVGDDSGWGLAGDPDQLWSYEELAAIKREINAAGLELEAIENFDPAHWYDVLLDGPKKHEQLENLKTIIRNVGRAGIPIFGYNFSIAGVAGRIKGRFARGEAEAVGMDGPFDKPMPRGMAWNMVFDRTRPPGIVPSATPEELWQRLKDFLDALIPVAEEAGVTLAAHPDDPPLPTVRAQPRLVYQPRLYQKLLDLKPSPRNALEFCVGTLAEMTEGDIYEAVETYSRQGSSPTCICATSAARCPLQGDLHRRRRR